MRKPIAAIPCIINSMLSAAVGILLLIHIQLPAVSATVVPNQKVKEVILRVLPSATGNQLVRVSLPLPLGFLNSNETIMAQDPDGSFQATGLRILEYYHSAQGGGSARQAIVTFPWIFTEKRPIDFKLIPIAAKKEPPVKFPMNVHVDNESLIVEWLGGRRIILKLTVPLRTLRDAPRQEVVEENRHYIWQRFHFSDPEWPRVIESREDAAGGIVIVAHIQRLGKSGNFAPDLGWELTLPAREAHFKAGTISAQFTNGPIHHTFKNRLEAECVFDGDLMIYHSTAPGRQRGEITAIDSGKGMWTYRYQSCYKEDKVPMQPMSWRRVEIAFAPPGLAKLPASLISPHRAETLGNDNFLWPALPPLLDEITRYHRAAVTQSAAMGDDFGNVTGYTDGLAYGGIFGMNRLNHGAAIFEDGRRSGDRRLINTGLLWCDNFFDQSIWWGENERGGTRYNNIVAMKITPPSNDYMWRSDSSVNFCTKGYDCFQLAWEETGDPRMQEALRAQVAYAVKHIHANQGECRNIGDARDFVRLYRFTGEKSYLNEALRLFRELRTKLSVGHLFDQGGKPLNADPPFIDEDERGLQIGYAKPYIIGYALAGLPELMQFAPEEPELKETVRAAADFLASAVDPSGGWRYPHPRSSGVIINQGMEHAWQLVQAIRTLGPEPKWLDAIEIVLRARIHFWQRTGKIFSGLEGWETSTGKVRDRKELQMLYPHPEDRDASRDYTEGRLSLGSSAPEGLVYFREVLTCYLEHRQPERLLIEPKPDEPLGRLLKRAPRK